MAGDCTTFLNTHKGKDNGGTSIVWRTIHNDSREPRFEVGIGIHLMTTRSCSPTTALRVAAISRNCPYRHLPEASGAGTRALTAMPKKPLKAPLIESSVGCMEVVVAPTRPLAFSYANRDNVPIVKLGIARAGPCIRYIPGEAGVACEKVAQWRASLGAAFFVTVDQQDIREQNHRCDQCGGQPRCDVFSLLPQ